jgi:hypothetical protein
VNTKQANFWVGAGLVGLGLVDAAVNPFAFVTAPELFAAGIALMVASQSGSSKGKNKKSEEGDS